MISDLFFFLVHGAYVTPRNYSNSGPARVSEVLTRGHRWPWIPTLDATMSSRRSMPRCPALALTGLVALASVPSKLVQPLINIMCLPANVFLCGTVRATSASIYRWRLPGFILQSANKVSYTAQHASERLDKSFPGAHFHAGLLRHAAVPLPDTDTCDTCKRYMPCYSAVTT